MFLLSVFCSCSGWKFAARHCSWCWSWCAAHYSQVRRNVVVVVLLLLLSLYHIAQFTLLIFPIYSVAYYYEWWDSGDDYRGLHIDLWIKVQENKCEFVEWEDKVGFFLEASLHSNWTELNLLSLERLQFDLQSNKAVNVGKTEVMSPSRILSIMWFIWKLLHTG